MTTVVIIKAAAHAVHLELTNPNDGSIRNVLVDAGKHHTVHIHSDLLVSRIAEISADTKPQDIPGTEAEYAPQEDKPAREPQTVTSADVGSLDAVLGDDVLATGMGRYTDAADPPVNEGVTDAALEEDPNLGTKGRKKR